MEDLQNTHATRIIALFERIEVLQNDVIRHLDYASTQAQEAQQFRAKLAQYLDEITKPRGYHNQFRSDTHALIAQSQLILTQSRHILTQSQRLITRLQKDITP